MEAEFVMRFQQFTGPAMAKGVEDTAFYCFNRLMALNEVGGDPGRFGVSPRDFHAFCAQVQRSRPHTMLASSTHDTKRSEDVRMRLSLLSEIPGQWQEAVARWSRHNEKYKTGECPDRNTEYMLYQTMLGAWPIGIDRVWPFMEKATREAKRKTSWLAPNEQFESATRRFIESLYQDQEFLRDFENFVQPLVEPGRVNSLALALLKLTSPGIPDFYQGSELWDLSLVDPDNRRPVDYVLRKRLLCQIQHLNVEQVWQRMEEGLPKLWTIHHGLRVRREHPAYFGEKGKYTALSAKGSKAGHAVAYLRGENMLVLVPRLTMKLAGNWDNTKLDIPAGTWRDELSGASITGGSVAITDLLEAFPVSLLIKQ